MLRQLRRTANLILGLAVCAAALACGQPAASSPPPPIVQVHDIDRPTAPNVLTLPARPGSVRFAVIGDSGRGSPPQHQVAAKMEEYRQLFSFSFVLMVGDNIYEGPATPRDYELKFEAPYRALLDAGVRFHAALGNHDDPNQRFYAPFNMGGERYYTFLEGGVRGLLSGGVRFFAVDTTRLDAAQLEWLDHELGESDAAWNIVFLHHPLYSSGRYGGRPATIIRLALEPILLRHPVAVVFAGHEHIYERLRPQSGIQYFITGGAGSLRAGDLTDSSPLTARGFDQDYHFMLIEIAGDALYFQAITRTGETVDAGWLERRNPS